MTRRPPRSTRTDTLFPSTTLFRSIEKRGALIDFGVLRDAHFAFGFIVSFVAGGALFGSAYIIPAFALSVIDLGPTHAGLLQLPGAAVLGFGLLSVGSLIQFGKVPPMAFIPLGILCFMRSEERRVGKECVSTCRSRWSPDH